MPQEIDVQEIDVRPPTSSRRALLSAAVGSAAAVAATAIAAPAVVLAHDPDDVQKGVDNPTTATTSITNSTVGTAQAPTLSFAGVSTGGGTGVHGFSGGPGSTPDDPLPSTGVFGSALASGGVGVTGFGTFSAAASTVGVFGSGDNGVVGEGTWGVVGVGHTGVQGFTTADDPGAVGVFAEAAEINQYALRAVGRVRLSRSGRLLLTSGRSSVRVTLAGVTTATHAFAQIGSLRAGYHISSVVPATGSFTIYLNKALTSNTYIHWFVLDA